MTAQAQDVAARRPDRRAPLDRAVAQLPRGVVAVLWTLKLGVVITLLAAVTVLTTCYLWDAGIVRNWLALGVAIGVAGGLLVGWAWSTLSVLSLLRRRHHQALAAIEDLAVTDRLSTLEAESGSVQADGDWSSHNDRQATLLRQIHQLLKEHDALQVACHATLQQPRNAKPHMPHAGNGIGGG